MKDGFTIGGIGGRRLKGAWEIEIIESRQPLGDALHRFFANFPFHLDRFENLQNPSYTVLCFLNVSLSMMSAIQGGFFFLGLAVR